MQPFLSRFHIRDMEQFSGVKAHTIRVWERRYGLLDPGRTDTNIRTYDLSELKVILNVAYLNQHGYKISKIAAMPAEQREKLVRDKVLEERAPDGIVHSLVLAMLSFDEVQFMRIAAQYEVDHGFRALVERVFVPLLERIGVLWQSSALCPAQEHFVSNIIRQQLIVAAAKQPAALESGPVHVLFLPENEIHELGLLYVNYLLRSLGKRTIYLGQSVPLEDLRQLMAVHAGDLTFIGLSAVQPSADDAPAFLKHLRTQLPERRAKFLLAGGSMRAIPTKDVPEGVQVFPDLVSLIAAVEG